MNKANAEKTLRQVPSLARSLDYQRSEWRLDGKLLHFAVRENCEHGGSYHSQSCKLLDAYQAKAARKLLAKRAP